MFARQPPRARNRGGFTLLEATVAVAIIGLVAVGTLAAFAADLRASTKANDTLPAAALAEERLARLELADVRELDMLPDSLAHGRFDEPFADYRWTATATPVHNETALYELTAIVEWGGGSYTLRRRRFRPATHQATATADPSSLRSRSVPRDDNA